MIMGGVIEGLVIYVVQVMVKDLGDEGLVKKLVEDWVNVVIEKLFGV